MKPVYQTWLPLRQNELALIFVQSGSFSGSPVQGGVGRVESGVSLTIDNPGLDVPVSSDRLCHEKRAQGDEKLDLVVRLGHR